MSMKQDGILRDLTELSGRAVAHYWEMRATQRDKQRQAGRADQGLRSAVTGGAHMDGFIDLFTELIVATGIPTSCVHRSKNVELPGFFRPTKEWDLLVIREKASRCHRGEIPSRSVFWQQLQQSHRGSDGKCPRFLDRVPGTRLFCCPQPFLATSSPGRLLRIQPTGQRSRTALQGISGVCRRLVSTAGYEFFCRKLVLEKHYTARPSSHPRRRGLNGYSRPGGGPFH